MTGALALPNMALVRPYEIRGDHMAPQLRSRDFLMVAPATAYERPGIYLLDFGDGEAPYQAERVPVRGRLEVRIWHPNPIYSRHVIGLDEFNARVTAIAVAEVRMHQDAPEIARRLAA